MSHHVKRQLPDHIISKFVTDYKVSEDQSNVDLKATAGSNLIKLNLMGKNYKNVTLFML